MELLNALDAMSGWQLTPEQRHAIFTLQATLTTLELGYQVQEKQIAVHTQAIHRQRHLIGQLLAMINQLKANHKEVLLAQDQTLEALVSLSDRVDGIEEQIDKIFTENGSTDGAIISLADQMKDLRPWVTSLAKALATDLIAGWETEVEPITARLDALEAQGNGKAPNRRTARKTTAK